MKCVWNSTTRSPAAPATEPDSIAPGLAEMAIDPTDPRSPTVNGRPLYLDSGTADLGGSGGGGVLRSRPLVTGDSVAASHRARPLPIWSAGGSRDRARGRGITGDLGPCRPGPTPAEPPRGSATVKIAQGKGNPEGNRRGTGTGQRPKGPNRRTPDEGKPEEGGRRGRTRRANGKPEESPPGEPEDVR